MREFSRPRIKICGITRVSDAKALNRYNPDFAGLIFYRKSPRCVSMKQANEICATLKPTIVPVAVFVDETVEKILRTCNSLRTSFVQLHGMSRRDIQALKRNGLRVIEALHIEKQSDWKKAGNSLADLVLIDNSNPVQQGGTGERFDWTLKPTKSMDNLILAGGLSVDNYLEGIESFSPSVLDFNSKVESAPGVKSAKKLKALFQSIERNLR